MIKYENITLEQIEFIKDADIICDGDNQKVIIVERSDKNE